MIKFLLISVNKCQSPYPVFPLGAAHVAGALKNRGFNVCFLDFNFDSEGLEKKIAELSPDYIGLSLRNIDDLRIDNIKFFIPDIENIIQRIKAVTDAPLILGGSAFSLFPEELLRISGAKYGITGEGEESLVQLMNVLCKQTSPSYELLLTVPGLVFKRNETITVNKMQSIHPSNITIAERPDELVKFYIDNSSMINVQTQRGCPYNCCYCSYPLIEGNSSRYRSDESIVEDINAAVSKGARYFFIVDSVFNTSNEHVTKICEKIINEKIDISWGCFLRPSGISAELMNLMAKAGLKHIEFGSDSLCDQVLEQYNKGFTFDNILKSSELARAANVHYAHFLIIGGPGESESTLQQTFRNSLLIKKTAFFPFTGMRIFPNTSLYHRSLSEHIINENSKLIEPYFYISPFISTKQIKNLLIDFRKQSPNWIIDEPDQNQQRVMDGLRKRGVLGPLWEFVIR